MFFSSLDAPDIDWPNKRMQDEIDDLIFQMFESGMEMRQIASKMRLTMRNIIQYEEMYALIKTGRQLLREHAQRKETR